MGNEQFLIVSYFVGGLVCLCLGLTAYGWLRRPAEGIFGALRRPGWERFLKRCFPASAVLTSLAAFLAVSYYAGEGCASYKYKDIVARRDNMISANRHQIADALSSIVVAVFIWGVIILVNLIVIHREQTKARSRYKE
jgi:hypothetical protein